MRKETIFLATTLIFTVVLCGAVSAADNTTTTSDTTTAAPTVTTSTSADNTTAASSSVTNSHTSTTNFTPATDTTPVASSSVPNSPASTTSSTPSNGQTSNTTQKTTDQISQDSMAAGSPIVGVWIRADSFLNSVDPSYLKSIGVTDVFINAIRFSTTYNYSKVLSSWKVDWLMANGIRVHAWIVCFKDSNGNWVNPANTTFTNALLADIQKIANNYNISGIHLDYVRYPGTAYKYSGATSTITNFVAAVKNIIGNKILSAALMPELDVNAYYYGQDYAKLAPYLDWEIPMAYLYDYTYDPSWIGTVTKYINARAPGKVLTGLLTYHSDSNPTLKSASDLNTEIKIAMDNGAAGYVLFRYGLIDANFFIEDSIAPTNLQANPDTGTYNKALNVALSATDNQDTNPKIYYTTNGIDPTTTSTLYTTPITIATEGVNTLKLIAVDLAGNISDIITKTYIIDTTKPANLQANPDTGTYYTAQNIILTATDNLDPNPKIYYTTNGTDPTTTSTLYTTPITIATGGVNVLKFIAVDLAGNISNIVTKTYTINIAIQPLTVTANPASGTYTSPQTVTLTTVDPDSTATTYYTTDGSNPQTSITKITYTNPIQILASTVLRFIAVDPNGNWSPNYTETYTINIPAATVTINQLKTAALNVKTYYESQQKTLPANVQINGNTITMPQLLYLLTTATIQINSNNLNPITMKTVNPPTAPSGSFRSGNIQKASFLTYAQNIQTFINTNGNAPNYATTNLGRIPFKYLVYMYSKIINYYGTYLRLPTYVAMSP